MKTKSTTIEGDLRRLAQRAWNAGKVDLAIELEATAFRCCGLDLNAEREARLARAKTAVHAFENR